MLMMLTRKKMLCELGRKCCVSLDMVGCVILIGFHHYGGFDTWDIGHVTRFRLTWDGRICTTSYWMKNLTIRPLGEHGQRPKIG